MSGDKLTVLYFPIKGRAEPIRLALEIGGVAFDDKRIAPAEWKDFKVANADKVPLGQMPTLAVESADGKTTYYAQSHALLRYAARIGDNKTLYPADDAHACLLVDQAMYTCEELTQLVAATIKPLPAGEWTDESKAAFRKELGDEKIPKILTALETMMGEHKFLAGDDISIADLLLTGFYDWVSSGVLDNLSTTIFDKFAKLAAVAAAVKAHPKVAAWDAAHAKK